MMEENKREEKTMVGKERDLDGSVIRAEALVNSADVGLPLLTHVHLQLRVEVDILSE